MSLKVTASGGKLIDDVDLVDGKLVYSTGKARELFESVREHGRGMSDEAVYELMDGWSNGYVSVASDQLTRQSSGNAEPI